MVRKLVIGIRWWFGVSFSICALGAIGGGEIIAGMFILSIGLLLIPPISKMLFKRKESNKVLIKPRTAKPVSVEFKPISLSNSTSKVKPKDVRANSDIPSSKKTEPEKVIAKKPEHEKLIATKVEMKTVDKIDDSIIDVTGEAYKIAKHIEEVANRETKLSVPFWNHHYVYSYSEIHSATADQKKFYQHFKAAFLRGEYLDLKGNTNYAFILLFDLLNEEFKNHNDFGRLENELNALELHYPKTKSYAVSFLIKKLVAAGEYGTAEKVRREQYGNSNTYYDSSNYDYWKLGAKYKEKLSLDEKQVELLNKLWSPSNNFCSMEFCCIEVLKLFLNTVKAFESKCKDEGTSLDDEFTVVSDLIARKYFRYRANSSNYKYSIETTNTELYTVVFKHCENAVRELYGHKRKVSTDTTYHGIAEIVKALDEKVVAKLNLILPGLITQVAQPDEATEIELNTKNTSRWKVKFEELAQQTISDSKQFVEAIVRLGALNKDNPSVENIFFEASKFIVKTDRDASLVLYLYYVYYDLLSVTFNNKQLAKTIQKSLFKTEEQLKDFESIVNSLIKDKDLDKAVNAVTGIFAPKRKRILLNTDAIKEAHEKHAGTVELLNEYLQDETEETHGSFGSGGNMEEEIKLAITQQTEVTKAQNANPLGLSETQVEILDMFFRGGYAVPQAEIEVFAKSKGLFRNQLIESINDLYYDSIDDLLIEEEDEEYIINENYYQRIFAL